MDKFSDKFYNNQLFKGLTTVEIDKIANCFEIRKFKAGELIIEENSTGNTLYLLLEGDAIIDKTLVCLFEGVEINPDDKKISIVNADQNLYFGELSLFNENQKRIASIIAKTEVVVAAITKKDFEKILNDDARIGIILLKNIIYKLGVLLNSSNNEISKLVTAFTIALRN